MFDERFGFTDDLDGLAVDFCTRVAPHGQPVFAHNDQIRFGMSNDPFADLLRQRESRADVVDPYHTFAP